ncbi:MAG TPA: glycosyltransferase family 4 protein [Gaiellaceae bacterium]|nr:glycosyltransferase family 4 protein [Gaiellaceae bacterium]
MAERGLRIVHVIARLNVGGASLHVLQLAAAQRRRGHEVLVVAGTLAPGEESMEYLAGELDVPLRRVPSLQRELSPRHDAAAIRELVRIVRSERPDVLHTHTAKAGGVGRVAALVARGRRPPVVVHTYHGHVLRGYFGRAKETFYRRLERVLARRTSKLVAVSPEVRDDLVALGVAPASRFAVIPYGFDLTARVGAGDGTRERIRADLGAGPGTFVVGWVGRLTAIKRPLDLVRVVAALVERDVDALLCLVGDGPDRAGVERLARRLGVEGRCRIVGFRTDLPSWYAAFDALCLTSANEGTPVAAIEALAAGKPVVATRAGGTVAVVDDGESGFLVPVGDVEALASRLAELAADAELRGRLGRRGREVMRERFGLERMVDDVERLYRSLLAA